MTRMAGRIVALEKKAPDRALTHEERLARLRRLGRVYLSKSGPALSAEDRERIVAKANAIRGRMVQ